MLQTIRPPKTDGIRRDRLAERNVKAERPVEMRVGLKRIGVRSGKSWMGVNA